MRSWSYYFPLRNLARHEGREDRSYLDLARPKMYSVSRRRAIHQRYFEQTRAKECSRKTPPDRGVPSPLVMGHCSSQEHVAGMSPVLMEEVDSAQVSTFSGKLSSRDPYDRPHDHGNNEDPPLCPAVSTRQGCLSLPMQRLTGTSLDNDHRLRSASLQTSLPLSLSVPNDALTMT